MTRKTDRCSITVYLHKLERQVLTELATEARISVSNFVRRALGLQMLVRGRVAVADPAAVRYDEACPHDAPPAGPKAPTVPPGEVAGPAPPSPAAITRLTGFPELRKPDPSDAELDALLAEIEEDD